jgi:hypothetical protein
MRRATFHLEVFPRAGKQYGLVLLEIVAAPASVRSDQAPRPVVRIWGSPMQAVFDRVVEAVKTGGGRASDIRADRKAPFILNEETAVRLGLLFLAIKPLRKGTRIEAIREATATMGAEEAYYWFSKCSSALTGRRATRAFRILLAHE